MKFVFGDIVVVDNINIGVVVKSWSGQDGVTHEVYVRNYNAIKEYQEVKMERYMVRHKELNDEEREYQNNILSY